MICVVVMSDVEFPLSGPVVQTFNFAWPMPQWGWPQPTINLGRSAKPELELEILKDAGSYGRQLGRIGDALIVLLKHVKLDDLDAEEAKAIRDLKIMLDTVADVKARHGVNDPLRPVWD